MAKRGLPSKYQPLQQYLATAPGPSLTLTFAELEACLGAPLPPGAGLRQWWWGRREHRAAWRAVGWRVQGVDVHQRLVTFVRVTPDSSV
jgi:hypothetical protein